MTGLKVKYKDIHQFGFEKLDVWQNSINLTMFIYAITQNFPKEEMYGLTSQIRRATVSISSNIAEGSGKSSMKDQARFSEIAFGSLLELINQIIIAYQLNYINEEQYIEIRIKLEVLSRQLNAYKKSQINQSK